LVNSVKAISSDNHKPAGDWAGAGLEKNKVSKEFLKVFWRCFKNFQKWFLGF